MTNKRKHLAFFLALIVGITVQAQNVQKYHVHVVTVDGSFT